ncbi:MAG: YceI family protein [Flavobacteriaceae bacterium]|nr:YceI family protein [Flavobacteriaceae bacterium]
MNRGFLLLLLIISTSFTGEKEQQYIERQGLVEFFSYTSVENIQAVNNTVLSIIDPNKSEIAIRILMRAFVFKKSLMHEHFNESYIESDLYPEATLQGNIVDFGPNFKGVQTRIIKGDFTLRGIKKPIEVKAEITKTEKGYTIKGTLNVRIKDYEIKVPRLLSPNIAKKIQVSFNFQYVPYEN